MGPEKPVNVEYVCNSQYYTAEEYRGIVKAALHSAKESLKNQKLSCTKEDLMAELIKWLGSFGFTLFTPAASYQILNSETA
jgi:hypothetical protein